MDTGRETDRSKMQVDQDLPVDKQVIEEIEECSDEMMKTTNSSEDKEKESSPANHAERIRKLHNQRV